MARGANGTVHAFQGGGGLAIRRLTSHVYGDGTAISGCRDNGVSLSLSALFSVTRMLRIHLRRLLCVPPRGIPARAMAIPGFFGGLGRVCVCVCSNHGGRLGHAVVGMFPRGRRVFPTVVCVGVGGCGRCRGYRGACAKAVSRCSTLAAVRFRGRSACVRGCVVHVLTSFLSTPAG